MHLEPLSLPDDFRLKTRATGIIALDCSIERVLGRFGASTRNQINRTYRDPSLQFVVSPVVSDAGYALQRSFMRARGMVPFPRNFYDGCVEFLACMDDEPVSGLFLFPSVPVALIGAIFSKRYYAGEEKEYRRIGNASKRVMAEACRWGMEQGLTGLDMGGLDMSRAQGGIGEYKMSFGPVAATQYVYTYTSPLFRRGEKLMLRLRRFQRLMDPRRPHSGRTAPEQQGVS